MMGGSGGSIVIQKKTCVLFFFSGLMIHLGRHDLTFSKAYFDGVFVQFYY